MLPEAGDAAKRDVHTGLFLLSLAILTFEILLTRIFSVTMWYHFAFLAISVAMFGLTVGAILVYLSPERFPATRTRRHLAVSSLLFAVSVVAGILIHLNLPFPVPRSTGDLDARALGTIALTYLVIAVPFIFAGIAVTLSLTRFPKQVSSLYAADLAGAGLGCLAVVLVFRVTDGPTAVLGVALVGALAAWTYSLGAGSRRLTRLAAAVAALLGITFIGNSILVAQQQSLLRIRFARGVRETTPLYEKWNSFSRITVFGDSTDRTEPVGWGMSPAWTPGRNYSQIGLAIDSYAFTPIARFDGDLSQVDYLKYDVTNIVHHLRRYAGVLVVGAGGGRDVLSALAFGQRSVVAVEINGNILSTLNGRFGAYSGHLDRDPSVRFETAEARSFLARDDGAYDILQVSMIDTWAATASGAFVLSEHALYTRQAWSLFLDRLSADGILSVSRWYTKDLPAEMYRTVSLGRAALEAAGVSSPAAHLAVVRHLPPAGAPPTVPGVGTVLISRRAFTAAEIDTLEAVCRRLGFDLALSPRGALDPNLEALGSAAAAASFAATFPLDVDPPTDDRPFFFHMLRFGDVFDVSLWSHPAVRSNALAVVILLALLVLVIALTALCIGVPLAWSRRRLAGAGATGARGPSFKEDGPLLLFFAAIGFGFIVVEIAQLQRLIVFLGHPTYGVSVVLLVLLLSAGAGSWLAGRSGVLRSPARARWTLVALLGILAAIGAVTGPVTAALEPATTAVRIAGAAAMLLPMGLLMGTAFPIGMSRAAERNSALMPWLWGLNGATSVCGSVLAMIVALGTGIQATYWLGVGFYVVAVGAYRWAARPHLNQTRS